ncbi:type II secretion system F family protein [Candidatus Margulisiibacteriota bacterium]
MKSLSVSRYLHFIVPSYYLASIRKQLYLSALTNKIHPERFLLYKIICLFIGIGIGISLGLYFVVSLSIPIFVLLLFTLPFIGFFTPSFWLYSYKRKRQSHIEKDLPFVIDLLTICVDAGLELQQAWHTVVQKTDGPLRDELQTMMSEIALGSDHAHALKNLAHRINISSMHLFTSTLIHAEQFGISLSKILYVQAEQMRMNRYYSIKEYAARIPIMILFPLIFFVFPTLLLILLGPGLYQLFINLQ